MYFRVSDSFRQICFKGSACNIVKLCKTIKQYPNISFYIIIGIILQKYVKQTWCCTYKILPQIEIISVSSEEGFICLDTVIFAVQAFHVNVVWYDVH